MKSLVLRFWNEQDGAVLSAEIMLIATILVLGSIVGLKSVRDSVVTELADVAEGVYNLGGGRGKGRGDDGWGRKHGGNSACVNVAAGYGGEW